LLAVIIKLLKPGMRHCIRLSGFRSYEKPYYTCIVGCHRRVW